MELVEWYIQHKEDMLHEKIIPLLPFWMEKGTKLTITLGHEIGELVDVKVNKHYPIAFRLLNYLKGIIEIQLADRHDKINPIQEVTVRWR